MSVLSTASTGVAATLLLTGRTAHSTFRIPIGCDSEDAPRIAAHERLADRLRGARVIIIDEVTMVDKDIFNYIDRTLRSLYTGPEKELPFAGKVICISGDWKQRLPIIPGAKRPAIVAATVKNSDTYHLFETLTLTENMRVDAAELEFKDLCQQVGNGLNFIADGSDLIRIPNEMLLDPENRDAIVNFAFPAHVFTAPLEREWHSLSEYRIHSHNRHR